MRLIINADDLGYSKIRDDGIYSILESGGLLTSGSLMVNGKSSKYAIEKFSDPSFDLGLHINLTEGTPVSSISSVRSLIDPKNGKFMRGKHGFRDAIKAGEISLSEVELEIENQLKAFIDMHPRHENPTHFDGHQHVHFIPEVIPICCRIFKCIPFTRISILEFDILPASIPSEKVAFWKEVSNQSRLAAVEYELSGFVFPKYFLGFPSTPMDRSVSSLLESLTNINIDIVQRGIPRYIKTGTSNNDTVEWMVHPGHQVPVDASADDAGCGDGPDSFSKDKARALERDCLIDSDSTLRTFLSNNSIRLSSFREL